jgi:hypothetical protein
MAQNSPTTDKVQACLTSLERLRQIYILATMRSKLADYA